MVAIYIRRKHIPDISYSISQRVRYLPDGIIDINGLSNCTFNFEYQKDTEIFARLLEENSIDYEHNKWSICIPDYASKMEIIFGIVLSNCIDEIKKLPDYEKTMEEKIIDLENRIKVLEGK